MLQLIIDLLGQLAIIPDGHKVLTDARQEDGLTDVEFMNIICTIAMNNENTSLTNQLVDILSQSIYEKKELGISGNDIIE